MSHEQLIVIRSLLSDNLIVSSICCKAGNKVNLLVRVSKTVHAVNQLNVVKSFLYVVLITAFSRDISVVVRAGRN